MNMAHVTQWPSGASLATELSTLLGPSLVLHFIQHVFPQRVSLDRAVPMTASDNLWHIKLCGDKMETSGGTLDAADDPGDRKQEVPSAAQTIFHQLLVLFWK